MMEPQACNAALCKPAYQISVDTSLYGDLYPAFLANDGNRTNAEMAGSCAVTQQEENPWLVVDLGVPMTIKYILLTTPGHGQCCYVLRLLNVCLVV